MTAFPLRISRADAIARAERGADSPVHAARALRPPADHGPVRTACGRTMYCTNRHPPEYAPSCRRCQRALALTVLP